MSETTIQLIVKGDSTETLVSIANRLNIWLCERPTTPPYPDGALLFWHFVNKFTSREKEK